MASSSSSHERGRAGEDRAVAYLSSKGYKILDRNFRTRWGEVDIVCETGREIVFVEVKSWRSLDHQALGRAIDHRKQRRIIGAARMYLRDRRYGSDGMSVRFDVVFVPADSDSVRHIKGAFDSEWPE
jgi:putative endonuclease